MNKFKVQNRSGGDDSKYTLFKEPRLRVNFIDALFAPQAVSNRKVRR